MSVLGRLALGLTIAVTATGGPGVAFGADSDLPAPPKVVDTKATAADVTSHQAAAEQPTPEHQAEALATTSSEKTTSSENAATAASAAASAAESTLESTTRNVAGASVQTASDVASSGGEAASGVVQATVDAAADPTGSVQQAVAQTAAAVQQGAAETTEVLQGAAAQTTAAVQQLAAPAVQTIQAAAAPATVGSAPVTEKAERVEAPAPVTKAKPPSTAGSSPVATLQAARTPDPEVSTLGSELRPPARPETVLPTTVLRRAQSPTATPVVPSILETAHPDRAAQTLAISISGPARAARAAGDGTTSVATAARPELPAGGHPSGPQNAPGSAGAAPFSSIGLFAALFAAVALAAQRLSRRLRLTPDLLRPPALVSILERPG